MKSGGLVRPLSTWIDSYLSGLTLSVMLKGFSSNHLAAAYGIPQRSHLGFYLFIGTICQKHLYLHVFAIQKYVCFPTILRP